MEKFKELSNPQSCLNKAAYDEPVFVLRAKDPLAAQTVLLWAEMAAGGLHEPEKIAEAVALANRMGEWRERDGIAPAQEGKPVVLARDADPYHTR